MTKDIQEDELEKAIKNILHLHDYDDTHSISEGIKTLIQTRERKAKMEVLDRFAEEVVNTFELHCNFLEPNEKSVFYMHMSRKLEQLKAELEAG